MTRREPRPGSVIPVLRIFDLAKAREFYVDFLGFAVDWEHRFGDDFPIYLQVSRDDCVLHLSEHHGDATPGARVIVATADVGALHAELSERPYRYAKPHVVETDWGSRDLGVVDPFGNRLIFSQRADPEP